MGRDKRSLILKQPCADCPFRKKSAPGWLGGYPLDSYAQPPKAGIPTSCHRHDKGAADPRTAFCAGSLALIANAGIEHLPEYAEAVQAVGKREDCIETIEGFRHHHAYADEFRRSLKDAGVEP